MNSKVVIEVKALSKEYRLGVIGHGTLYRDMQSWWAKFRGKEDPNTKIFDSPSAKPSRDKDNARLLALADISFCLNEGDIVGIIGRNGAGKSTLLKILSRITAPTTGEIRLKGRVASLLEVGTGFNTELTGRENIYLNGAILGMTKREITRKFDEIVAFSEVEKFIDTPVKRYSSGMIVRLAFSVAAHLEAEILVVDEVLAVGDLSFRKKCLGKMRDISTNSGRTVLFVSHDMSAIQNICTKGILIQKGRMEFIGSAGETVRRYLEGTDALNSKMEWIPTSRPYPFQEVVKITRFCVADEVGNVVGNNLLGSKTYQIVIEGELYKKEARLIFMVAFYSRDRSLLFATDVHDMGDISFGDVDLGQIRLTVPLPTHLLMTTLYEIELLSCLHHVGWILPPDNESRLKFEMFCDNDMNPYAYENRLGVLAPVIRWSVSAGKPS